jgi:hypothetical protein
MLDQGKLKSSIQSAFEEISQPALETAFSKVCPKDTNDGSSAAKNFADTATELISEPLAERLASAIDYYVRNANVFGNFMILGVTTVGSPCAQSQVVPLPISVQTMPVGMGGGCMPLPNTLILGIQ